MRLLSACVAAIECGLDQLVGGMVAGRGGQQRGALQMRAWWKVSVCRARGVIYVGEVKVKRGLGRRVTWCGREVRILRGRECLVRRERAFSVWRTVARGGGLSVELNGVLGWLIWGWV